MARSRRARRVRLGDGLRRADAALSRLLLSALTPPTGRVVLVNGFEAWVEDRGQMTALTTQQYAPDVLHPDGASRIRSFDRNPWPTWQFALPNGATVVQELFAVHGISTVIVAWTLAAAPSPLEVRVRPLISGRDYHATHHENASFRFDCERNDGAVAIRPYEGLPSIVSLTNGRFEPAPAWYREFSLHRGTRARA